MLNPPPRRWTPLRFFELSAFWFALSFHWAILLSQVLQHQVELFAPKALQGTVLGLVGGGGALISAVVQILVGWHSDRNTGRWGRRRPYIAAGTLSGLVGLAMMAGADSLAAVAAAYAIIQLTTNVANGPYQALLPDLVPRERHGLASTWMGLCRHLGEAAGPVTAGWLLSRPEGMPGLMFVDGLVLVAFMLVTLRVREERCPTPPEASSAWEAFRVPLRPFPDFVRLLASRTVINLGFYTALTFFYFYVQYSLHVEEYRLATGQILSAMVFAGLVGGLVAGPLADRYDKVHLIYGSSTLTAGAMVWFVMAPDYRSAFPAGLVMGLGFGAFTVVDWALAFNLLPPGGSARYMGIWNLTAVFPMVLAPAIAGPLTDLAKAEVGPALAYRGALAAVVFYLVVGTVLLTGIKDRQARARPPASGASRQA